MRLKCSKAEGKSRLEGMLLCCNAVADRDFCVHFFLRRGFDVDDGGGNDTLPPCISSPPSFWILV